MLQMRPLGHGAMECLLSTTTGLTTTVLSAILIAETVCTMKLVQMDALMIRKILKQFKYVIDLCKTCYTFGFQ